MALGKKATKTTEFGDFQTPPELTRRVCGLLARHRFEPASILEPTCGTGQFLFAALDQFPEAKIALGFDINAEYVKTVQETLRGRPDEEKIHLACDSFFHVAWSSFLKDLPDPLLILGNPPWVTSAGLGSIGSSNLPRKSNFLNFNGLDAITGKSNFDISEWMLLSILHWLNGRNAMLAMLCKTSVARKVLIYAWKRKMSLQRCRMYLIDATANFGAAVDACLLVCRSLPSRQSLDCSLYQTLEDRLPRHTIGYRDDRLLANVSAYERWKHLYGESPYTWRSGIKHDCAKVMEFRKESDLYRKGLSELVELEDDYLFPMLKGSELARGLSGDSERWMLVTQCAVGDDTSFLHHNAPKTWAYLQAHAELLDRRASSIYKRRPRFAIFGVGDYSFSPWKVAISGFYKKLEFKVVGNVAGKPVVLDDTTNFLSCESKQEAEYLASLLNSSVAREFFEAFVFWDAKRPITIELLRRLDLQALAQEMGVVQVMTKYLALNAQCKKNQSVISSTQLTLFES